ncbi:Nodulin 22 [Heracleum sosnowskyi]|uniref:Nodulin 22 n=1 Tax=Heracleum sosnowskyi TaxID=360622 RepID=A0AAD8ITH3_9APIA|nr:Nodulin 22 [Heracleum sosnowskyi]
MKVIPLSTKRNVTFLNDHNSPMDQRESRKLRRLPHVFGKVLQLPFRSDADVIIEDTADAIRFIAEIEDLDFSGAQNNVRAHAVEIHPGITKIVIRNGEMGELLVDQLSFDVWRYRLPAVAMPELVTAVFANGELIVTVPKSEEFGVLRNNEAFPRIVVVQNRNGKAVFVNGELVVTVPKSEEFGVLTVEE